MPINDVSNQVPKQHISEDKEQLLMTPAKLSQSDLAWLSSENFGY